MIMRKKLSLWKGAFCLLLLACACSDELSPPSDAGGAGRGSSIDFSTESARLFFEKNAEELRSLSFTPEKRVKTRAADVPEDDLTPLWHRAKEHSNAEAFLVEIPLLSSTTTLAVGGHYKNGDKRAISRHLVYKKLIVAKRKSGAVQMFVVTLIPDRTGDKPDGGRTEDDFSYLGGGTFSGIVFCSSLNGMFAEAYNYKNGWKTGALHVVPSALLKENEAKELQKTGKTTIQLFEAKQQPGITYANFVEQCLHGRDTADCWQCLDEVTVIPDCLVCGGNGIQCGCCQKCRTFWNETCEHKMCWVCEAHPCRCGKCYYCFSNPCECVFCTKCHRRFCFGECDVYEPPLPGCPYGECKFDPCICCGVCMAPCRCRYRVCHRSPCICCYFCKGECFCPNGKCHEFPCVCPCYDPEGIEADPFRDATIPQNNLSWKSNVFGWNRDGGKKFHDGIDLLGSSGVTPVQAMYPGKVIRVVTGQPNKISNKKNKKVYPVGYVGDKNDAGNRISVESTLSDGTKVVTNYWHLDVKANNPYTQKFKVGNIVSQGQAIGVVGYTGNANKDVPHLHLKMAVPGKAKDDPLNNPERYLYTKFSSEDGKVTRSCNE